MLVCVCVCAHSIHSSLGAITILQSSLSVHFLFHFIHFFPFSSAFPHFCFNYTRCSQSVSERWKTIKEWLFRAAHIALTYTHAYAIKFVWYDNNKRKIRINEISKRRWILSHNAVLGFMRNTLDKSLLRTRVAINSFES